MDHECEELKALREEFEDFKLLGAEIELELEKQVEGLRVALEDSEKEVERMTERMQRTNEELAKTEKLLETERDKASSFAAEKDSLKKKLVSLEIKLEEIEEKHRSLEMQSEDKDLEIDRLKEELIIERMERMVDIENMATKNQNITEDHEDMKSDESSFHGGLEENSPSTKEKGIVKDSVTDDVVVTVSQLREDKATQTDPIQSQRRTSITQLGNVQHSDLAAYSTSLLADQDARKSLANLGRKRGSVLMDDEFLKAGLTKIADSHRDRINSRASQDTHLASNLSKKDSCAVIISIKPDEEVVLTHIPLPPFIMQHLVEKCRVLKPKEVARQPEHVARPSVSLQFLTKDQNQALLIREKKHQRESLMLSQIPGLVQKKENEFLKKVNTRAATIVPVPSTLASLPKEIPEEPATCLDEAKESINFIKQAIKTACLDKIIAKKPEQKPNLAISMPGASRLSFIQLGDNSPTKSSCLSPVLKKTKVSDDPDENIRKVKKGTLTKVGLK